jgi:hypothetical protein
MRLRVADVTDLDKPLATARFEIHCAAGSRFDAAILKLFDQVSGEEFEAVRKRFPDIL